MFVITIFVNALVLALAVASQTKNVDVTTIIQNHFAETTLSSEIFNDANTSKEIGFQVMLPKEAFITHFEMTIDDVTYEGVIEEKNRAKKLFTEAKRRGKTTGLVEAREEADKIFKTSVNVGAETSVRFKLVYQQLLRKIRGKYTNKIILFGDQLSEHLTMNLYICEHRALKNVSVPPILVPGGTRIEPTVSVDVNGKFAHVQYLNDNDNMMALLAAGGGAFSVEYELHESSNAANIVVNDGYFIYFGPDIQVLPRRVVFVLDVSGSMGGKKIIQLKQAMINILDKMTPLDRFDIIKFSTGQRTWMNYLASGTPSIVRSAKEFINGYDEFGGTYIWGALEHALGIMTKDVEAERALNSDYIVLLTDGMGSVGLEQFRKNVRDNNNKNFTIHTISFGTGANNDLLKAVARDTGGRWKQILEDLDSALQIENFIDEVGGGTSVPLVIDYPEVVDEFLDVRAKYGGEIMNVGKFKDGVGPRNQGPFQVAISGFSEDIEVVRSPLNPYQNTQECGGIGRNKIDKFAEKAYGMVKVENAMEEMELNSDPSKKDYFREQAVNISMLHKLVTSVTSLLVIKPEDEKEIEEDLEDPKVADDELNLLSPAKPQKSPPRTSNRGRKMKKPQWSLHSDPHFVARLSNDITVCFNWMGRDGEVVNLLGDDKNSIFINALIEGDSGQDNEDRGFTRRLFVTKLAIHLPSRRLSIEIDPDGLAILNDTNPRDSNNNYLPLRGIESRNGFRLSDISIDITEIRARHVILSISVGLKTNIVVEVHHGSKSGSRDHLDFAMPDYENSGDVGGLFGHLQRRNFLAGGDTKIEEDRQRGRTFLVYNQDKILVKKTRMRIPYLKTHVDCWMAKGHFQHLLGSKLQSFKMRDLTEIPGIL